MRSKLACRSMLIVWLLLSTVSAGTIQILARPILDREQTPQKRPPRPFPPAQYIPSHDYDTKHVSLNLHFDWEHEQAIGTATITLSPLVKDLRVVEFDAANMSFYRS